jgi:myosin-light-chain kinase
VNRDGHRIKIIDFGLARKFDPTKQLKVLFGTPEFVAPEVINFDRVGFGTDMWLVFILQKNSFSFYMFRSVVVIFYVL